MSAPSSESKFDLSKEKHIAMQLVKRPVGLPTEDIVNFVTSDLKEPSDGEVLVKVEYVSIDPTHRIWMTDKPGYMPPVKLNENFRALGSGVVVLSKHKDLKPGDKVSGLLGVQNYCLGKPETHYINKLPDFVSLTEALDVYGINGLTAYVGLMEVGKPQQGDVVLVSGAAGAVGCIVGQIAKQLGCRVVGIAGTDDKCTWLTKELGFDAALNYKKLKTPQELKAAIAEACPNGVNIFFDNVGGDILDAALENLAMKARIVYCGGISQYNNEDPQGPKNYKYLLYKRARAEGFIFLDHAAIFPKALSEMKQWNDQGKLKHNPPHIEQGLQSYIKSLNKLFTGTHTGKTMLKV